MGTTHRPTTRIALALGSTLLAAGALGACSSSGGTGTTGAQAPVTATVTSTAPATSTDTSAASSTTSSSSATSSGATSTGGGAEAPGASTAAGASSVCQPSQLTLRVDAPEGGGSAGHVALQLIATNKGTTVCTTQGFRASRSSPPAPGSSSAPRPTGPPARPRRSCASSRARPPWPPSRWPKRATSPTAGRRRPRASGSTCRAPRRGLRAVPGAGLRDADDPPAPGPALQRLNQRPTRAPRRPTAAGGAVAWHVGRVKVLVTGASGSSVVPSCPLSSRPGTRSPR